MGKKAAKKEEKTVQEEAQAPEAAAEKPPAAAVAAEPVDAAGGKEQAKAETVVFTPEAAVQYDLTTKITPHLDRHLIFPMLDFLQQVEMYNPKDVARVELQLLSETYMIDFAMDKYAELGEDVPEALPERREEVLHNMQTMQQNIYDLLAILEDSDQVARIPELKSRFCDVLDVHPEIVHMLVDFAKMKFDAGDYATADAILKHYRTMVANEVVETSTTKQMRCCWGALACALLARESQNVHDLIHELDAKLEESKAPKREVLLHRTWLLHWSLFAIFKSDKVDPRILDFFLNEKSLSIISLSCPHLFRYVGACLILQKRLKQIVNPTVWIISHESGSYSDPVTRFLLSLYTEMDFDDAQRELQKCELVCKGDHFLAEHWAEFQENARLQIFESYCRTHQCINIQMIASKLNMEAVEAELWIVKLIQNAKLDARIDSEKSRVVMTKAPPNVYQQVIEKTKNLAFRSTMLVSNLEKR